jgi:hypothetical protein
MMALAEERCLVGGDAVDELAEFLDALGVRLDQRVVIAEVRNVALAQPLGQARGQHYLLVLAQPDTGVAMDQVAEQSELGGSHGKE